MTQPQKPNNPAVTAVKAAKALVGAELDQMWSPQKKDAKANAQVVKICAGHRHTWQQKERRLNCRIHESAVEATTLRVRVAEIEQEETRVKKASKGVYERTEMVKLMSKKMRLVGEEELDAWRWSARR